MLMSGEEYRESLRRLAPRVYVNGDEVASVADEPRFGRAWLRSDSPTISRATSATGTRW